MKIKLSTIYLTAGIIAVIMTLNTTADLKTSSLADSINARAEAMETIK